MTTENPKCVNICYPTPRTRPGYLYAEGDLSDLLKAVRVRRTRSTKKQTPETEKPQAQAQAKSEAEEKPRRSDFIPIISEIPEEGNEDLNDLIFNRHQIAKREREEAQAEREKEAKIINARIPKIPHPDDIYLNKAVIREINFKPLWSIFPRGLKGHDPQSQVIEVSFYMKHKTAKSTGREQVTLYQEKPFYLEYHRETQVFIGKGKKIFKYLSQKMGGLKKGSIVPIYWSHNRGRWNIKVF